MDAFCPRCNGNGICEPGESCLGCPTDCKGRLKGARGALTGSRYCCGNGTLEAAEGDGSICNGNP